MKSRRFKVWFINTRGTVVTVAEYGSESVANAKKKEIEANRVQYELGGQKAYVVEIESST